MERGDVLPARFGTVLASEEEVSSVLARWGGLVRESLARFSGLVEVEAAATWDLERTLAEIARQPEVAAAKATAERASPAESLARRVEVGQLVERALDQRRALYQAKLLREVGDSGHWNDSKYSAAANRWLKWGMSGAGWRERSSAQIAR